MSTRDAILELKKRISQSIIGQEAIIERLIIGLLTNGNLLVEGLEKIWKDSHVLQQMRDKSPKGKCRGCDAYGECLGGCTARSLAMTGEFNSPDPHCWRPDGT